MRGPTSLHRAPEGIAHRVEAKAYGGRSHDRPTTLTVIDRRAVGAGGPIRVGVECAEARFGVPRSLTWAEVSRAEIFWLIIRAGPETTGLTFPA